MTDEAHAKAAEVAIARETRLTRLEDDVKKLKPKGKDGWEKLQAVTPLIAGVVLAFVSYLLTGSVNNAIQRQQLQLSNVKEMRDLLAQLDTADAAAAESAAFTLSAFGRPAVPPLMAALLAGGEVRAPAAERSLRAIGMNEPAAVCGPIRRVIDNRTGRFSWLAHLSSIPPDWRPRVPRRSRLAGVVFGRALPGQICRRRLPVRLPSRRRTRARSIGRRTIAG